MTNNAKYLRDNGIDIADDVIIPYLMQIDEKFVFIYKFSNRLKHLAFIYVRIDGFQSFFMELKNPPIAIIKKFFEKIADLSYNDWDNIEREGYRDYFEKILEECET